LVPPQLRLCAVAHWCPASNPPRAAAHTRPAGSSCGQQCRLRAFRNLASHCEAPFGLDNVPSIECDRQEPNILWITSEDNSPYLGCYGDPLAQTPHLDRLAAQGVRYRNAFANAPVCSTRARRSSPACMPRRSASTSPQPRGDPRRSSSTPSTCAPRATTARTTRRPTTTSPTPQSVGREQPRAHYKNRAPGQPFFAVFNFTTSHESQVAPKPGKTTFRVPPEKSRCRRIIPTRRRSAATGPTTTTR
jgi:hypothetical protein